MIDLLPSQRERWMRRMRAFVDMIIFVPGLIWFLIRVLPIALSWYFEKAWCLWIEGNPKNDIEVQAAHYSVKRVLDLPHHQFRRMERRIPGPLFRGEQSSLEWLAGKLREEGISCKVRKVPVWRVTDLEHFRMTYRELSAADAYADQVSHRSLDEESGYRI